MNRLIWISFFTFLLHLSFLEAGECFLAYENGKFVEKIGNCHERYSPCCTFNIAISVIAFNERVLFSEHRPIVRSEGGECTPLQWIKDHHFWFSQFILQELGARKVRQYLADFNYGNQDISGDRGKGNGLTDSWVSGSLKISPLEQLYFLDNLCSKKLSVYPRSIELTGKILYVGELENGWKLYGKTGSGTEESASKKYGWFIGWIEKGDRVVKFVQYSETNNQNYCHGSQLAKEMAGVRLNRIIQVVRH